MVAGKESRSARRSMASPSKRQRMQAVPLPPVEEDVCVAAIHGKCDDTVVSVVPVHVVWTAETSRLVRVGGGQVSVFNLTVTDGNDMVGVTLWRGRELAGKLSKRLAYLFGAGQEADPPTFVRLVLKRFRVCPVRPASPMCMKALRSQTDSSIDVMRRVWHSRTLDRRGVTVGVEQSGRHVTVCPRVSHRIAARVGCLAQRFMGLLARV